MHGARQATAIILETYLNGEEGTDAAGQRSSRGGSRKEARALLRPHPRRQGNARVVFGDLGGPPGLASHCLPGEQAQGPVCSQQELACAGLSGRQVVTHRQRKMREEEGISFAQGQALWSPACFLGPWGLSGRENYPSGNPAKSHSKKCRPGSFPGLRPHPMTTLWAACTFFKHFKAFRGCSC